MTNTVKKNARPLSPHLQAYRMQINMVQSILHRMTGYALAVGTLMVVWLLLAAAYGQEAYAFFMGFANSPLGMILWLGWTIALFYHLFNGIRHFFWDLGGLFDIKQATMAGYIVLALTALATAAVWACVFWGV